MISALRWLAVLIVGLACTDEGPESPMPGVLSVRLTIPANGALVMAFGPLESGVIAEIDVPDVRLAAGYQATIVDVAAPDFALRALGGYSATVER